MRLRTRLALAVVCAAAPLAAGTVWLGLSSERQAMGQVLREFAVTRMESGGRERCEESPETFPRPRAERRRRREGRRGPGGPGGPPGPGGGFPWGGPPERRGDAGPDDDTRPHGGPPEDDVRTVFFAYAPDLVSKNPNAPPIAPELAAEIGTGADVAVRDLVLPEQDRSGHEALVRMAWDTGPGAFVLVRRTAPNSEHRGISPWWAGAGVGLGVLVAVLLALAPVVRRIRALEQRVRDTQDATYDGAVPVTGRDEITDLARAFNEAAARVRDEMRAVQEREDTLRDFVANTTHDVMTPLTVLQGHLSTLRDAVGSPDMDDDAREAVRDALREVDYTTSLVANLSTVAKLEADAGGLERHQVNLGALVDRVIGRFTPVARAHDLELNAAVPPEDIRTLGDVTLIEQAVGNVVQNAVRYNRAGGHVAVLLRQRDGRFSVVIRDDGPGIPADKLERVTQRGQRGDTSRSRAPGGHGLGLDIARSVCERHGIELTFTSPDEGGLEVTFSGPLAPQAA